MASARPPFGVETVAEISSSLLTAPKYQLSPDNHPKGDQCQERHNVKIGKNIIQLAISRFSDQTEMRGKTTAVVLSGGNVDEDLFASIQKGE